MGIGNPVHLIFLAAIALVVLGPKRLPELARSLGNGMREFRDSLSDAAGGDGPAGTPVSSQPVLSEPVQSAAGSPRPHEAQIVATSEPVGPTQSLPSGDAPDSRPL